MRYSDHFFYILACALLANATFSAEDVMSEAHRHEDVIGETRYVFVIDQNQLGRISRWSPSKDAPNPPTSVSAALTLANEGVAKIELGQGMYWQLDQISLRPINPDHLEDGFIYFVKFRMATKGFMTGIWPEISFPVLMDGTRIDPVDSRRPGQTPIEVTPPPGKHSR